jgi:hypothetical protein
MGGEKNPGLQAGGGYGTVGQQTNRLQAGQHRGRHHKHTQQKTPVTKYEDYLPSRRLEDRGGDQHPVDLVYSTS